MRLFTRFSVILQYVWAKVVNKPQTKHRNGMPMLLFFLEECLREEMCITCELQRQERFSV